MTDGDTATSQLLNTLLNGADLVARYNACLQLVDQEKNTAILVEILTQLMADADWGIRQISVWAAGQLQLADAIPTLMSHITAADEDEQVRYVAALAIVYLQPSDGTETLQPLTQHSNEAVRRVALAAIHAVRYAV